MKALEQLFMKKPAQKIYESIGTIIHVETSQKIYESIGTVRNQPRRFMKALEQLYM